jgi:hypothetical protein
MPVVWVAVRRISELVLAAAAAATAAAKRATAPALALPTALNTHNLPRFHRAGLRHSAASRRRSTSSGSGNSNIELTSDGGAMPA